MGGTPILWLQRGHFCAVAGLTQTLTQMRKRPGSIGRTQWIAHRAESTQKRRKALRHNAFRRSSYLHTQEVTGSSPAVSTTRKPWKPWYCVLFAACLYVCLSLLVLGQYAAVWRSLTSARVSNRGHQAAELSCGRLRRCPVILPVTDLRIFDLFLRYRGGGKCRDKIVSKNAGRIFLPFRLHTILPAFMEVFIYCTFPTVKKANTHYLRIKCVLRAHHENNAY